MHICRVDVNLHKTTIVCECYWGTQCTSKHVGFITTIRLKNIWNYVIGKPKHFMCIEWQCNYLLVNYHLNSAEILLVVWNNTPQMIFIPKCVLWINSKQLPFSIFLWDILGYSTHIVISVKIQDSYPCVCVCDFTVPNFTLSSLNVMRISKSDFGILFIEIKLSQLISSTKNMNGLCDCVHSLRIGPHC